MQVGFYMDEETNERLTDAARERGESRNMLILRAVREWLTRQDGLHSADSQFSEADLAAAELILSQRSSAH